MRPLRERRPPSTVPVAPPEAHDPPIGPAPLLDRALVGLMIGGLGVGCLLVLWPFFSAILGGGILVFSTWPLHESLRRRLRLRRGVAAGLMTTLATIILVLPLALAAPTSGGDVALMRAAVERGLRAGLPDTPDWFYNLPIIGLAFGGLWHHWAADVSAMAEAFRPYFGLLAESGFSLLLGLANGVVLFMLALFIAFFFYLHAEPIAATLRRIFRRLVPDQADHLIAVTGAMVRGTVYGILGTAILQGVLSALGLWLAGAPRPVLLGAIVGFLSILPIGAPLVWVPAALWLLSVGRTGAATFLAVYGVTVITGAYYIVQPWIVARGARLPFLLTVLGVLGGALAFGLLGIFLGPVLLGVGFTLVREWGTIAAGPVLDPEPKGKRELVSSAEPGRDD